MRVLQAVTLVVCLAVAVGAPRGLLLAAVAAGVGVARNAYARQTDEARFDVVSIKRNTSGEMGGRNAIAPQAYVGVNVTLRRLIALAYQPLSSDRIVGGPAWMNTDRFDVRATFSGTPPRPQLQRMLRALAADHFRLRGHMESRPTRVYVLMPIRAGETGPGLRRSDADCSDPGARAHRGTAGGPTCAFHYTDGLLRGRGVTLDQIAAELVAGRAVVNRTGIAGVYDVDLRWAPDSTQPPADDAPPTLTTALREQLGLRLEPATMPMDHLVVDGAERPEEN